MTITTLGSHVADTPLRVQNPSHASMQTRLSPIALTPVRWALTALTLVGKYSPVTVKQVFAVSSCTDVYAAPLLPPRGTRRRRVVFDDSFRGEWLWRPDYQAKLDNAESAILYLHGGAFISCGLNTHRRLAAKIGESARQPVLNVAYRQLPGAHITETVEDCVTAYQYLLDSGFPAERIVLAGDSAGGGLVFLVAMAARDRGMPMPAALVAQSPVGDLDNAHRIAHPNAGLDAYIPTEGLGVIARWGFARAGVVDSSWSPVNNDFTGLPPVLIQVGSTEIFRSDAERLAECCADAAVACTLQIWDRAPHVFQIAADVLPEGNAAIRDIAAIVRRAVADHVDLRDVS